MSRHSFSKIHARTQQGLLLLSCLACATASVYIRALPSGVLKTNALSVVFNSITVTQDCLEKTLQNCTDTSIPFDLPSFISNESQIFSTTDAIVIRSIDTIWFGGTDLTKALTMLLDSETKDCALNLIMDNFGTNYPGFRANHETGELRLLATDFMIGDLSLLEAMRSRCLLINEVGSIVSDQSVKSVWLIDLPL